MEFIDISKEKYSNNDMMQQQMKELYDKMKSGQLIMGECKSETNFQFISQENIHYVNCGYDSLVTAYTSENGLVKTKCLHCSELVEIEFKNGEIVRKSSEDIHFWFGSPPQDAQDNPVCDHLHLFPSLEHLQVWVESKDRELGITFNLNEFIDYLDVSTDIL